MIPELPPNPPFINLDWLFLQIYNFFLRIFGGDVFSFNRLLEYSTLFFVILIILVLILLISLLVRMYEVLHGGKKKEAPVIVNDSRPVVPGESGGTSQTWERIRTHVYSEDESKWRLAIIEADIYLDTLLDKAGYTGDTLGDKLKKITPQQLASIDFAWEAHKVRNKIAHEGADFTLTFPETRRVILMYEVVFRELGALS